MSWATCTCKRCLTVLASGWRHASVNGQQVKGRRLARIKDSMHYELYTHVKYKTYCIAVLSKVTYYDGFILITCLTFSLVYRPNLGLNLLKHAFNSERRRTHFTVLYIFSRHFCSQSTNALMLRIEGVFTQWGKQLHEIHITLGDLYYERSVW